MIHDKLMKWNLYQHVVCFKYPYLHFLLTNINSSIELINHVHKQKSQEFHDLKSRSIGKIISFPLFFSKQTII